MALIDEIMHGRKPPDIKEKLAAAINAVAAVAEAIRELREVPSGVFYANLPSHAALGFTWTRDVGLPSRSPRLHRNVNLLAPRSRRSKQN